ncbi:MAG: hypothetical protein KGZ65_10440 [Sphingomonadales bacterium]|nr:hypothetical protein [Sphingomonadaceae bacterium]MBS3931643.1 hypothetical protein [Sphingomonadales bacterium]
MTDHSIRFFDSAEAIRHVGEGLLARTLPRPEWTHEAHLAACAWLVLERPDIAPETDMPEIIRSYNVAAGGENTDSAGYHETLTQLYIKGVRRFLATCEAEGLLAKVNALLASDMAPRDWPLRFYSRELLFSAPARRGWVEPDLAAF